MPGVLVDSSSHSFFPFEPGSLSSPSFFDSHPGFDLPTSFHSPPSEFPLCPHSSFPSLSPHLHSPDLLPSPPLSPSDNFRELAQRFLPRSNLGFALAGNIADSGNVAAIDFASELNGVPIPPRKGFYGSCTDSIVGSPVFPETSGGVGSPVFPDAFAALQKYLPSNADDEEEWPVDTFPATDVYSCDDFRMYEFKVRRCMRGRSHDWTECPFAHPGEKARRRDPRRIHYSGTACPDFRKGTCKRGDGCEYAHGVFECWLHPARYRTQPCKDGRACRRKVCFFAHTAQQLRVLPQAMTATSLGLNSPRKASLSSYDGSPLRQALTGTLLSDDIVASNKEDVVPRLLQKVMEGTSHAACGGCGASSSSPTLSLHSHHASSPPPLSPPLSPSASPPMSPEPYACRSRNPSTAPHLLQSPLSNSHVPAHRRHLNRLHSVPTISIPPAAADMAENGYFDDFPFSCPTSCQSPHSDVNELLQSFQSLQLRSRVAELQRTGSSPVSPHKRSLVQQSPLRQCLYRSIPGSPTSDSLWNPCNESNVEMQPAFRVESGRDLRTKIYGKIGKENGVDNEDPDLGWVNELVK